ncbi:MAG TPA: folylpolyglutamate synthase/dihydrofolate synthase family protein [Solirubrobacteraceae bacterium]|nr:folylpolyglutamate synthase/dihydrofolate synthase family protein [Solirubrobacteraceae bacterium]
MNPEEAERYILSRELFGMRFGLDRMRRLMTAMGNPQLRFQSIHVVGTNGKSSTVRMTAAILRRHGLRTGAYLSPHLVSFAERIRIEDEDLEPAEFAGAIQRAAHAAELVDRSLGPDDRVTQFELLTAAAYSELAREGVEVAVIEAGLGGRYDATNVIPSRVQVLTSVGLEHTRWLGPTITAIATEKLDVVRPGATLVLPPTGPPPSHHGLHPDAVAVAEQVAAERGATIVRAGADPGVPLTALGPYQRRNFALARAAAEAYLGKLDPNAVATAAAEILVPGRLQVIDHDPLTLLDGAHNPEGMAALAEALEDPFAAGRRPVVAVVSILDDKDAASMLAALIPKCDALVLTASQNPRALPPPTLESLAGQLGGPPAEVIRDPRGALGRAREIAGPEGLVLATGSIYLVADLLRPAGAGRASML